MLEGPSGAGHADVAFSPDGAALVGRQGLSVDLWDAVTGARVATFSPPRLPDDGSTEDLVVSEGGRYVAMTYDDAPWLFIWRTRDGKLWDLPAAKGTSLRFAPGADILVVGQTMLWSSSDERLRATTGQRIVAPLADGKSTIGLDAGSMLSRWSGQPDTAIWRVHLARSEQ
jgi:WD40 repeat protein